MRGEIIMKIDEILNELTLEEKAALVSGTDFMYTNPIPRLNIPSLCMADGPHGLRKQTGEKDNGVAQSEPATSFPTAACTSSSWNPDLIQKMGEAIAKECRHYGVHVLLGPGVNIKRNPLCGRNFEYFSEDPFLSGKMGSGFVQGVQSQNVGVSLKHYALNNAENYRFMGNSIVDMRAAREIYLKSFERVVKEAKPATLMCAYNQINGTYCCENEWLLTDVLRKEWGFDGAVMTDWGAMHERVPSLKAGLDLEMPGDTSICRRWIIDGVKNGELSVEVLDQAVRNILKLIDHYVEKQEALVADFDSHHELAGKVAADSAVLMKNEHVLPLTGNEKLLIVGDLFKKMRYQGSGSSMICPTQLTSPQNAFDARHISYEYEKGYSESQTEKQSDMIKKAVEKAKEADTIMIFAGLTDFIESEGKDRDDLYLPENQLALIDALSTLNKKTVVVLFGGSVIDLAFIDHVDAVLNMFLPGQNGGEATVKLLYGEMNPSGHLSESWPMHYEDVLFYDQYSKNVQEVYQESVYVGYRYYQKAKKQVRFPFGYGLSYTQFAYDNLQIKKSQDELTVTCDVTNTGNCFGATVVQLYIQAPKSEVYKPEKELRGFKKTYLEAKEKKQVEIHVPLKDLTYFNISCNDWVLESGEYECQIGSDCETIHVRECFQLEGQNIPSPYSVQTQNAYEKADVTQMTKEAFEEMSGLTIPPLLASYPVTLNSRFTDLKQSSMGKILFHSVLSVASMQMHKAKKLPEGSERDNKIKGALFLKRILESNSVLTMSMSGGKSLPYNLANAFVEMTNGHLIKGIRCILHPIKVPKLPKDN